MDWWLIEGVLEIVGMEIALQCTRFRAWKLM